MAFSIPTLEDLHDLFVATFANAFPGWDVSRGSDEWIRRGVEAGGVAGTHAHLAIVGRDAFPSTAQGDALDDWGATYGVTPRGAVQASGEDAAHVLGTNGSSWQTTDPLVHASGRIYYPTASGTLGASGEAFVGVIAAASGSLGNLDAGEVLVWLSPPAGLETEVAVVADISGGVDIEGTGSHRARLLDRIGEPAKGGSANDYHAWVLEALSSIASSYVWPNRGGLGSVDVAGLKSGSGSVRLLDASERGAVAAYLATVRPVGPNTIRVLEVLTETVDIEAHLTPLADTAFARDWNDTTPPEIASWTPATRTVVLTADRPDSMAAGHRVVFGDSDGTEHVIESLSSTDAFVVRSPVTVTPTAAELVYSGGPLVTPARSAALALIDSLGPRTGDYSSGKWVGSLIRAALFQAIQTVAGVLDHDLLTPSANVEPTAFVYPDDDQVNLLVPGIVLVRYA